YLSKATGVPLAKVAARLMLGRTLAQLGLTADLEVSGHFVKTPVFPFVRFPGVDTILGPEMKSTGEVMGGAATFRSAFAKAQLAPGQRLPSGGTAFISVNNHDKPAVLQIARDLRDIGFKLVATRGTANCLGARGTSQTSAAGRSAPAAPPTTCARTASKRRSCSRSTRDARTSATRA